jgi:hypothetical protein
MILLRNPVLKEDIAVPELPFSMNIKLPFTFTSAYKLNNGRVHVDVPMAEDFKVEVVSVVRLAVSVYKVVKLADVLQILLVRAPKAKFVIVAASIHAFFA